MGEVGHSTANVVPESGAAEAVESLNARPPHSNLGVVADGGRKYVNASDHVVFVAPGVRASEYRIDVVVYKGLAFI